ncbi:MAG: RNA polymerase subunit sigma-24, partial [Pirellulaceae bacterium]|nr:RNA polymerase subunit sigma-24 [Pirellulaceae bacterium]
RTFLLSSLTHYLTQQWRRAQAQKRGGERTNVSIDFSLADQQYRRELGDDLTPEKLFERQ